MNGKVLWSQKLKVPGSYKQEAYSDKWELVIPVLHRHGAKHDEVFSAIRTALQSKNTPGLSLSSYSATKFGLKKLELGRGPVKEGTDLVQGVILVEASYWIGD